MLSLLGRREHAISCKLFSLIVQSKFRADESRADIISKFIWIKLLVCWNTWGEVSVRYNTIAPLSVTFRTQLNLVLLEILPWHVSESSEVWNLLHEGQSVSGYRDMSCYYTHKESRSCIAGVTCYRRWWWWTMKLTSSFSSYMQHHRVIFHHFVSVVH